MSTLNLPFTRFTRQVSNGMARTKYSYQAMQQDLLTALQKAIWKEATCSPNSVTTVVNKVTQTDGEKDESGNVTKEPTYTTFLDERFDAYKQGGDANSTTASFCGYAGMVAYRFDLPTGYSSNITQVEVPLQASRYLRSGLRVCVVLSNSSTPSANWSEIRGDGQNAIVSEHVPAEAGFEGVSSWGVMNQSVPILLDTKPQEKKITFKSSDYPELGTSTRYAYLWVYVSIEDYCDYWTMYSVSEPRYYSIEGSATVVGSACTVSFVGNVTLPTTLWRHTLDAVSNAFYLPNAKVIFASRWDEAEIGNREAFGNLLDLSSFEAGLILDASEYHTNSSTGINVPSNADSQSFRTRLLEYARFPRKNTFTKFYSRPPASGTDPDAFANVFDVGVFAVNPAKMQLSKQNGGGREWENNGGGIDGTIRYDLLNRNPSGSPWADTDASVNATVNGYAMLYLKSTARIVPHGKPEYKKMSVLGSWEGTGDAGSPAVEATINIWKSTSADALGYWRIQAISSLLSHQELYTVSEKSITVGVTGSGTWSSAISLNVTAEYVGSMPTPSGSPIEFELDGTVAPGDMLIFVPSIKKVSASYNSNSGYVTAWGNTVTFDYILVA